jgi:hypothetical protein
MSYTSSSQGIDAKTVVSAISGVVTLIVLYWIFVGFGASISNEEYTQLRDGMSYEQVVSLVGGEGSLVMDVGTMGMQMRTYQWSGPSMGNEVILNFDGGRLSGKLLIQ